MYFIIINPIADRGQAILRLPLLAKLFDGAGIDYEVHITTMPMDGYEYVRKFCVRRPECTGIIGVGGDGIIQEIVAGMADAFPSARHGERIPIPLGILPAAISSNFVSVLEGGKARANSKYKQSPEKAVRVFFDMLIKRRLRPVDIITADGMAFMNIGHVGIDAQVAMNSAMFKKKYDEYAYLVAGVKSVFQFTGFPLTIDADGEKQAGNFMLAAVCNGQYYGGGTRIAPPAEIDDGKITLCTAEGTGLLKASAVLLSLLNETHEKKMSFKSCESLKLTLPPTLLCLDGNLYPKEGEVEFKILPGVLEVFV